jgi:hypothetical protein
LKFQNGLYVRSLFSHSIHLNQVFFCKILTAIKKLQLNTLFDYAYFMRLDTIHSTSMMQESSKTIWTSHKCSKQFVVIIGAFLALLSYSSLAISIRYLFITHIEGANILIYRILIFRSVLFLFISVTSESFRNSKYFLGEKQKNKYKFPSMSSFVTTMGSFSSASIAKF